MPAIQVFSIVLPTVWTLGTETETVADLLTHVGIDIPTEELQEKAIHIVATERVAVGAPGALWCWVELSPVASAVSTAYWSAIGGGGGALAPVAPAIEAAVGVDLTVHSLVLPWTAHSAFARVVVQTPVAAGLPGDFWVVQVMFSGKGP